MKPLRHDSLRKITTALILTVCLVASLIVGVLTAESAYENTLLESVSNKDIYGLIDGLAEEDRANAVVVLYDSVNAYSAEVGTSGEYCFDNISAGTYFIKIEVAGYKIPTPQQITVDGTTSQRHDLSVTAVKGSDFYFQWKADSTYFGYEESASVPSNKTVVFLDELVYVGDSNATAKLNRTYKVILSNEELSWSTDYASRLLELIDGIDCFPSALPSKWVLTAEEIDDDIEIIYGEKGHTVRINKAAFENAIPRKATLNGLKGTYFSNRLYHALIRYATKEGTDVYFIDNILRKDYGCSIIVEDYEALTAGITNETAAAFEQFKPEELLAILEMFAEMPEGFHAIENLEYLVRRIDGSKNPIYPQAAAVSWIYAEHGYIEFMDSAFLGSEVEDTFRLVLHEKTHFLWTHVFSEALKAEWIRIGGWYETDTDSDGWATSKETEFVTAYAHAHNPDEDMAESVAYYILMPDRLESRSPDKYAFIRDYIMNGEIYMTQIREDLTFEVYNLYPDYNYPGRIVGVDVDVSGAPREDKEITVTLQLDTHGDSTYGASSAFMRIFSEYDTFYDLWLAPVEGDTSILRGTFTMSKYAAAGHWYTEQISLYDTVGNPRFSGADNFGWKLYIDNPLADTQPPEYISNSIYVEQEPGMLDGRPVTYVHVKFKARDNIGIQYVYCEIANNTHNSYRMDNYGTFDNETGEATITYTFTEYMQSGEYSVNFIKMVDYGENGRGYNFFMDGTGAGYPATFVYESDKSDYNAPDVNLNNIKITAYPTHPENPNGETVVMIDYFVKDNASGLGNVYFKLLDPLGKTFAEYHYHENFYTTFFEGDPTVWKHYHIQIILPEGSAPGKWGLLELSVSDKAGNSRTYNFLEIVHFAVDEHIPTYQLSSQATQLLLGNSMQLNIDNPESGKKYIWECQSMTGSAAISQDGILSGTSPGYVKVRVYEQYDNTKYGETEVLITSNEHHMDEWKTITPETCTSTGIKTRSCTDEGCDYFESEVLPLRAHEPSDWIYDPSPTCTDAGYRYTQCMWGCKKIYQSEEVLATGHSLQTVEQASTCVENGYIKKFCVNCDYEWIGTLDFAEHAYETVTVPPTCTKEGYRLSTCSVCGKEEYVSTAPSLGHDPSTNLCDEDSYCTVCGTLVRDASEHNYVVSDWVSPTCTLDGYYDKICTRCDHEFREPHLATGHMPNIEQPTCTENSVCIWCDEILLHAIGHCQVVEKAVEPTCTETGLTEGRSCSVCNEVLVAQTEISALGHQNSYDFQAATCTEEGFNRTVCTVCGEQTKFSVIEPLGHDYQTKATASTCVTSGNQTYTCTRCNDSYREDLPLAAHVPGEWTVTQAPAPGVPGTEQRICTVCGAVTDERVLDPLPEETVSDTEELPTEPPVDTELDSSDETDIAEPVDTEPDSSDETDIAEPVDTEPDSSDETDIAEPPADIETRPAAGTSSSEPDESSTVAAGNDNYVVIGCSGTVVSHLSLWVLLIALAACVAVKGKKETA